MSKLADRFEIIEDQPLPRKRKQKSKDRPSFNDIPWRLITITVAAGITLGMGLIFFLIQARSAPVVEAADLNLTTAEKHVMGDITDVAFSGSDLIAVDAADVYLYKGVNFYQHLDIATANLILSPDGTRLASLANFFNDHYTLLQLWDVASGKLLKDARIDGDSMPTSVQGKNIAFSADGRLLAVNTRSGTFLLDVQTMTIRTITTEREMGTIALVFSPDANRLIAIFEHDEPNFDIHTLAQVWDIHNPDTAQLTYSLHIFEGYARDAVLSADGHYLAYTEQIDAHTTPKNRIHIHDMFEQKEIGTLPFDAGIRIGPLSLSSSSLAFVQNAKTAAGDYDDLHLVRWSSDAHGFHWQTLAPPQPLNSLDVAHLHLWTENHSSGLDYLVKDTDTVTLFRWDFTTNTIRALPL